MNAPEGHEHLPAEHLPFHLRPGAAACAGFAEEDLPVTLSISLHAPNDEVRKTASCPWPTPIAIEDDAFAGLPANYVAKTGRRVIFEYALVGGSRTAKTAPRGRIGPGSLRGLQLPREPDSPEQPCEEREPDAARTRA